MKARVYSGCLIILMICLISPSLGNTKEKTYGEFPGWFDIDWKHLPSAAEYPLTGGVYLRVEHEDSPFELGRSKKTQGLIGGHVKKYHDLYLILDDRGIDSAAQEIFDHAIRFDARMLRDGHTVHEVHGDPDHKINSEAIAFKTARPGDIIEVYQQVWLPPATVFNDVYFVSRIHPVLEAQIKVRSKYIDYVEKNFRVYNTDKKLVCDAASDECQLTVSNIPAVPEGRFSPPVELKAVWMQICWSMVAVSTGDPGKDAFGITGGVFGSAEGWDAAPGGFIGLDLNLYQVKSQQNLPEAAALEKQKLSGIEGAKAAYELVAKKSLEDGKADQADFYLLQSLLKDMGIKSDIYLVRSSDLGPLDADWPSSLQFNRRVLKADVDGQEVWMDPGFVGCPFGQLPWFDYQAGAFFPTPYLNPFTKKDPNNCKNCPITTPQAPDQVQSIERNSTIAVDGDIKINTDIKLSGWWAMKTRNAVFWARTNKIEQERIIRQMLPPGDFYKDAKYNHIEFKNLDEMSDPLVVHLELSMGLPKNLQFLPLPFMPDWYDFNESPRLTDVLFPVAVEDEARYHLSGSKVKLTLTSPAPTTKVENQIAFFEGKSNAGPDGISIECRLVQRQRKIPLAQFQKMMEFQKAITAWKDKSVVVK